MYRQYNLIKMLNSCCLDKKALNLQNLFNSTIANLHLNLLILKTKTRSMLTLKDNCYKAFI